nr:hypothetical protein [Tanacetum cinerariifolium]
MYVINVEPIPHRLRNNRKVHLDYLKHLKESVATLCEILEEAKVKRPLDRSVASTCLYTKHSHELLEYVIGTCLKDFNKRDKKQATTSLNRKKQVTFADQCETSNMNTQKHVEQQITQKTNVLVLPSTRVDSCTDASGSKPRRNTKKSRISPAKSVNKKTVKDHSKTNKSHLQKPNRFDSSISSKRTVIVEFQRISLTGFRSCASRSQTGASQSRQSTEISIFTVSTYISLRCSGNTTWIMRRTLDISLTFTVCEEASKVESCPSKIILDDLLALDSIVHFDFE